MAGGAAPVPFGPYLIYEELGAGGMASVHRAEVHGIEGFSRTVALKRMLPHLAGNEEFVRSFVREARLASHLRHTNVAQTYDLGIVDGVYYIAMELISGRDLREVLRQCALATGPMPVPIALNLLAQICDALDYAHNLCDETGQPFGIIHRDVSPSNIIVAGDGVLKLIDFGIAKASAAGMQTMSGTVKGKFAYMAPEYIAGSIDARADLFAVGVIAHELLTSRPLFAGRDDGETVMKLRNMEILPPSKLNPQVPPEIDDLVMTALARDPERRWQVASALRSVLNTVTRRMGLVAHNHDVTAWLAWAFAQPVRQRSGAHALPADVDEVSDVEIDVLAGTGAGRRTAAPIGTPSTPSGPPAGPTTGTPSGPRPAPLPTMVGVGLPSSRTGPVGVPSISGSRPVQPGPATPAATGRDPAFVTGNVQVAAGTAPPAGPPTAPRTASTAAATPTAGRRFGFVLLVALAAGGAAAAVYFALLALT